MTQAQSKGGASKTLGEAVEGSRKAYHADEAATTKGRAGRKDPQTTDAPGGEPNVKQD